ncbi:MAG: polysaccharide biosynthesis/export family protein [Candidatus Aceula meridiana]|nr:polysaccharide biosynthesis/export family protein [Candidatus Aceula meridiana]
MLKNILIATLVISIVFCASSVFAQKSDYIIQPEDVLDITVYENPDLKTQTRVSSEGDIPFPLLGNVNASGLTVRKLKDKLTKALEKDYLVSAQVNIFIKEYHVKQVTVLGSVIKPGKYDMFPEKETTVLDAIALAGGFSKIAQINGTRIIRTEDNEEQVIPIRVTDITKKGLNENNIPLNPGDIVFIPESFF